MESTDGSLPDFQALFQAGPDPYLVVDRDFRIVAVADAYLKATMTRRQDILGRHMFDVFPDNPDEIDATGVSNLRASFAQVLRSGVAHFMAVQKYDIREPSDTGSGSIFAEHYWQPANFPVLDDRARVRYIIHRVVDVTELHRLKNSSRDVQERLERDLYLRAREIEHGNELLRESLLQKETLLREIHHRVKNNLQVIAALLRLQAQHVTDQAAQTALSEMDGRIRAIADIHQTLYSSFDLARVDMSEFATQLAKNLLAVYGVDRERVRLQLEIASSSLDIGLAVPCGLILNELISNALKHAFPIGRRGTVVATLDEHAELLSVSDDGVGLGGGPAKVTLGMQLVHLLAEQIGAQVRVESERGTRVTVTRAAT
ncbi:histidine kinase, dimerization/phosphoacceptor [Caballeronia calidae]|uniref:histidine kinase n=1 Tax=Caballeronia calidae TaxID=1777139 RepID=A0A157ZN79_9BURK|nr:PAS domain-containing sensor histidine kinase [Caballeronia calidae]SAK46953.1 histidine kinase, dimerization/phosphoacceptor [Caballeronia calidae]